MDRIKILAPTILAACALLGEQGARLGGLEVPPISIRWALLAAAAGLFLSPRRDQPRLGRRVAVAAVAMAAAFGPISVWRSSALRPALAIPIRIQHIHDAGSPREALASSLQLAGRRELRRLTGERRNVGFEAEAVLEIPRDGLYRFTLECDDTCELRLGDTRLAHEASMELERGEVPFTLRYRQNGGPAALLFSWRTPRLIELLPIEYYLRGTREGSRKAARLSAHFSLGFAVFWWGALFYGLSRLAPLRAQLAQKRWIAAAVAAIIIVYGCVLRVDALFVHSGNLAHESLSGWVPPYALFNPANATDDPYRADVRSYLDRAETFSWWSFYASSFREPFYIALSMPFLALAGGEIGILIQSCFFSCATLLLFFWIARRLHGPWWAVALLVPVALHEWLILEAPTGYRMSAYVFFLLTATAIMVFTSASRRAAGVAGTGFGLLSLIRLSALSVAVPLLAVQLVTLERHKRRVYAVWFLALLTALVAPFLVSNAVAQGDPFYSISFHTEFWLHAEGLPTSDGAVSWGRYFTDFGRGGALMKGTALGMTTLPLRTFWIGLRHFPLLDAVTLALGVLGLGLCLFTKRRFIAAGYFAHLIPFAYIQNFPSGQMPRFVMPSYFFLVLAAPIAWQHILTLAGTWTRGQRAAARSEANRTEMESAHSCYRHSWGLPRERAVASHPVIPLTARHLSSSWDPRLRAGIGSLSSWVAKKEGCRSVGPLLRRCFGDGATTTDT